MTLALSENSIHNQPCLIFFYCFLSITPGNLNVSHRLINQVRISYAFQRSFREFDCNVEFLPPVCDLAPLFVNFTVVRRLIYQKDSQLFPHKSSLLLLA